MVNFCTYTISKIIIVFHILILFNIGKRGILNVVIKLFFKNTTKKRIVRIMLNIQLVSLFKYLYLLCNEEVILQMNYIAKYLYLQLKLIRL